MSAQTNVSPAGCTSIPEGLLATISYHLRTKPLATEVVALLEPNLEHTIAAVLPSVIVSKVSTSDFH